MEIARATNTFNCYPERRQIDTIVDVVKEIVCVK